VAQRDSNCSVAQDLWDVHSRSCVGGGMVSDGARILRSCMRGGCCEAAAMLTLELLNFGAASGAMATVWLLQ
jgi:hypothetical protein